jgi:hypothetical protein
LAFTVLKHQLQRYRKYRFVLFWTNCRQAVASLKLNLLVERKSLQKLRNVVLLFSFTAFFAAFRMVVMSRQKFNLQLFPLLIG